MKDSELDRKMLDYGDLLDELEEKAAEIIDAVLERGKTRVIGKLRARYYNPRRVYDYFGAVCMSDIDTLTIINECTDNGETDWRAVCGLAGITDIPYTTGKASVALILEK